MKARLNGVVLVVLITVSTFLSPFFVYAQDQNYYIVIGTFSSKEDAAGLTSFAKDRYLDSAFLADPNNLFQLYVLKTSSKEAALTKSLQLQKELQDKQHSDEAAIALNPRANSFDEVSDNTSGSQGVLTASTAASPALRPKGKFFKFTVSTEEGNVLPAKVHHVDFDQVRDLAAYNSENYVDILRPGKNEPMAVVCGIFGYKEMEKWIDYTDPASTEGIYQDENGAWVIPYVLERLEKGDVSVMYNVSFYKDAVVMLENSQKDLDELVNMMLSNPNYVIKVHGHCNGRKSRKIIALGDSKNYFNIEDSTEMKGSAKQLSSLRAEAVRSYLIDHGINESRIKIFAWGGSYKLVDEDSGHAKLNDRIEIEILKD